MTELCKFHESDDSRESALLFQRLSMTIQRFNAVAIQGTFARRTPTEDDILAVPANLLTVTLIACLL